MKEITTSKGTFLFVEVPDDIMFQSINFRTKGFMHFKTYSCTSTWSHNALPDGKYQLICTTKNATEEHAAMVVEEVGYINGNIGYKSYHREIEAICHSALFSLLSLIDGAGLNIDSNYAIIQKL